ncbi:MAG: PAS domain S-box protein [Sterolibacterium sp.]
MSDELKILIFEDNETSYQLILRTIMCVYPCVHAVRVDSEQELLSVMPKQEWHVVLLDYNARRSHLKAILTQISETWSELPLIAISGDIGEEAAVELIKLGAWDYVKNTNLSSLVAVIKRNLLDAEEVRQRKLDDIKLRADVQRFHDFSSTVGNWYFWEIDSGLRITYFSRNAEMINGIPSESLIGKPRSEVIKEMGATDQQVLASHIAELRDRQTYTEFECKLLSKGNGFRWLSSSGTPFFAKDGQFLGYRGTATDITKRKLIEEERERYVKFFNAASDLMFIADTSGLLTTVNPAFIRTFGYSEAECLTMPISKFVHPDDRHKIWEIFQKATTPSNGQMGFSFEHRYVCKDDSLRWIQVNVSAVEADGSVYCVGRDITDRKDAEAMLSASEQRFHELLSQIQMAAVMLDPQGNITFCNNFLLDLAGKENAELVGQSWFDHFIPDDLREWARRIFAKGIQTGVILDHHENDILIRQGERRLIAWDNVILRGVGNQILGMASIGIDITNRKQMEEALKESESLLRESQFAAGIGSFKIDINSKQINFSETFGQIFGIDENYRWNRVEFDLVHPDDVDMIRRYFEEVAAERKPIYKEFRTIRRSDGDTRWVLCSGDMHYDAQGKPITRLGTVQDITERKRIEMELLRYREHLEDLVNERTFELSAAKTNAERANFAKSAFLTNMSHELRTPLNTVIGFSRLMANTSTLRKEQRQHLDIITRSGNHLLTLVNSVLDLAKIEAGRVQVTEVNINLRELLDDVCNMLRPQAEQAGLHFHLRVRRLPATIRVDGVKLRQILINLLKNAIKFTPEGSISLHVAASLVGGGKAHLNFTVHDTGIGIGKEHQASIFEPFVQIEIDPLAAGTGLGLAICQQYLSLMGSRLTVKSVLGQGSNFQFSLTVSVAKDHAVRTASKGRPIGLRIDDRGKRILVAEDNADARLLTLSLLEPLGFVLLEAEDGAQAVEKAAIFKPDLILMDWRMPRMDGTEATRRIRASAGGHFLKIVMFTANAFAEYRQEALAAGADELLYKPLEEDVLFDMLEKQLGVCFERDAGENEENAATETDLTAKDMAVLSTDTRTTLAEAIRELNPLKIAAALEKIRPENSALADRVSKLVGTMQYQKLWIWLTSQPMQDKIT